MMFISGDVQKVIIINSPIIPDTFLSVNLSIIAPWQIFCYSRVIFRKIFRIMVKKKIFGTDTDKEKNYTETTENKDNTTNDSGNE